MNFIIEYKIYPFSLMVSIGQSYSQLKTELMKRLPEDVHSHIKYFKGEYDARTLMFPTGQSCICFVKTDPGIISHEVFHAVCFLMRRMGVKLSKNNDETYAYLIQYITREIHLKLNQNKDDN